MTFKEQRYEHFKVPREMLGNDIFGKMIIEMRPKPKKGEHFEFQHFGSDDTMSNDKVICYFWIYKVYEQ